MPKLILDTLGGDYAPYANLYGAALALPELHGELVLVGRKDELERKIQIRRKYRPLYEALNNESAQCIVRIAHASENIGIIDSIKSVRTKPDASINVGCRLAAQDWKEWKASGAKLGSETQGTPTPSAFISSGHSGVMMASALLHMKRLKGIDRPAIAVNLPTLNPEGCVMLDVGANVDCKPEHLRDFALMGALYAQAERQKGKIPRVGLLSNGEERTKGNETTRKALELIEALSVFKDPTHQVGHFAGYVEGKELFKGEVDVLITDGFVGNLVLKSVEGLGSAVVTLLKREAKKNPLNTLGFVLSAGAFRRLKKKLDYAEYGAAPLLGVAGYAFICHGRSNAKAIKNALLRTQTALKSRFVERLDAALNAQT